jgi:hypothetical protein
MFWAVYHCEHLRTDFTVTNARLFRETEAAGLHDELPAQARVLLGSQAGHPLPQPPTQ